MNSKIISYPSDLNMNQIRFIRCAVPELFVRKLKYRVHHIVNAILYLLKTGCQWKMLPASYPN